VADHRRELEAYLTKVAAVMLLPEWEFYVSDDPAAESAILDIEVNELRHFGKVRIGTFFDYHPEDTDEYRANEQRQAVVHEILHVKHAHLTWWLQQGTWTQFDLTRVDKYLIESEVTHSLEVVIDFAARLIAPQMPLPPKWKGWPAEEDKR
jgi:hypothetical protein